MRYALDGEISTVTDGGNAVTLITEDGGLALISHNGEHRFAVLYEHRCENFMFTPEFWDSISEGKTYLKVFDKGEEEERLLSFCLEYLCLFCPTYERVDFEQLVTEYNDTSETFSTFDGILHFRQVDDRESAAWHYHSLSDDEKEMFYQYVETLKHYECEDPEEMEKQMYNLLNYLNR
jgi:hypothetical protein